MADFRLGRLKFNWRGAWAPSTAYVIDDIISFKGNTYVCVVNHTSAASETSWASTDLNIATPRWQLHVPGVRSMGPWSPNTFYAKNDLISYGSSQYICASDHTSSVNENLFYSNDLVNWQLFTSGVVFKGLWSSGVWYKLNDIIKYGNTLYISTTPHTSSVIFDPTKFDTYLESFNFENTWLNSTEYQPGDIVNFGGYTYIADSINIGKQPNVYTDDWKILTTGFTVKGEYSATDVYVPGDVVTYGGNTYVKKISGVAGIAPDKTVDLNGIVSYGQWDLVSQGLAWKENWASTETYQINDVVKKGSGSYVSLIQGNLNNDPASDDGTRWQSLAQGDSVLTLQSPGDILIRNANANVPLGIGVEGNILTVAETGLPAWERNNWCANVYYVATDGTDDPDYGKNISKPWRSLRYALSQIPAGSADAINTIFVKSGAYEEQLPLVTEPFTSIVGDNLRATIIKPKSTGLSTDLTPIENRFSTMFYLSESVTLKDLVMVGMEGYTPASGGSNDWDITQATVRGVFLRLHPDDAITGKSPYITQCSAFSGRPVGTAANCTGGVGALVDKSIYSVNSNGSMLFDSFTQFHDGGVGFWCKDLGNAEIVSSFTYYCHIGYTCTGGGRIRSLAGNNSYGVYGAVSAGYDATETPLTGTVRGQRLNFTYGENSPLFKKYEQVVQGTDDGNGTIDYSTDSGLNPNYALALILYVQDEYLIIEPITGTFTNDKPIQGISSATVVGSGALATTDIAGALAGLSGKIFTLTNLPVVEGSAVLPKPTGTTKFLPVAGQSQYTDNSYYVIKDVTDPDTAQTLTLSTLRRYDVPGEAPTGVEISTIAYSSALGLVTITTSSPHGLSSGDEVVVVIANAVYQPYASAAFQRQTVTITGANTFTYAKTALTTVSPAVAVGGSKVYLQNTSGGSTRALHTGGRDVNLYNVSATTTRLDRAGTQELDTSATSITFADTAILSQMSAGVNSFILVGNELMRITQINAGLGVDVDRAQEGTSAATHADGSVIYYVTKSAAATTLRGDVNTAVDEIPVFSISNFDSQDIIKVGDEFFRITSVNSNLVGQATVVFSQPKTISSLNGQAFEIRLNYSQVRLTGHDFLLIGTGNKVQTNWPNTPLQQASQVNEVYEDFPGRVYYVSTDQDGNFRVGEFFRVEQATGTATLDANAFDLSGLSSLRLGTIGAQLGAAINEFSTDVTLGGDFSRDTACPTQLAVKTYVDTATGSGISRTAPLIGVAALESIGTTATVTSYVSNNVYVGDKIVITGADQLNYNGEFTITSIDVANNAFNYTMSGNAVSPATGTITCERKQKVATDLDIVGGLKVRPTWNNASTVFGGIDVDITDTISQLTSKIIDAKVGGSSKFSVDKAGNIVASGNLTVAGTTTTVNSTDLSIADKTIIIGNGANDSSTANDSGLQIGSSNLSFKYSHTSTRWDLLNAGLNVGGNISISGNQVLSSNTLGSGITASSLTSLGTLSSLTVSGLSVLKTISEDIVSLSGANGTVSHDFSSSAIFYHTGPTANFTTNLTNVPTTQNKAYSIALIINQGGTARIPSGFAVNSGAPLTINWANGAIPNGNENKIDIVAFSVVNVSGTFVVYGQLSSFG